VAELSRWQREGIPNSVLDVVHSVREVESNIPIVDMKLVETLGFDEGIVTIRYHCVSPFCPAMLVLATGLELKSKLSSLAEVKEARVSVVNHYLSEKINKKIESFAPKSTAD